MLDKGGRQIDYGSELGKRNDRESSDNPAETQDCVEPSKELYGC